VLVIDDSKTILKVVGTILSRSGYEPVLARDGMEGLERLKTQGPIDLVLLDFVMPRMNGYQFCRQLRADSEHAKLPVVLMSARTEAIGDRFVEQTGAVDALGKPFDARALIAVVGRVLSRAAEGGVARHGPGPEEMMAEEDFARGPESMAPASRHFRTLGAVARLVAEAVTPSLKRLRPEQIADPAHVANAIALSLNDDALSAMAKTLDEVGAWRDPTEMLRGDLERVPLAELLQFLQLQRQTAVLHTSYKTKHMAVAVRDGMVDLVQSRGVDEEFRLGRYFVKRGLISREEIDRIVGAAGTGKLIGALLVEQGRITAEQLKDALVEQSSELTYELLRWPSGRFVLVKEPFSDEAAKAKLGLGMSNLVLEGFRRVDEWRVMEKTIDFEAVLVLDQLALDTVDSTQIGHDEMRLLKAIDGQRTVRQVMAECALASFDAIQIVYRFVQSRIVRAKGAAAAQPSLATAPGVPPAAASSSGLLAAPAEKAEKSEGPSEDG
jgi:DNA-binding response OmpR family regulator